MVLESLDMFFRPLTNGSLCLSIVGTLSRQLFSGKSGHFTSSCAGFSLLCRRLRGVLVRAHRDVPAVAAYESFAASSDLTCRQGSVRRDCACIDQRYQCLSYRIAHKPRGKIRRRWLSKFRYVTLGVPCAWVAVNVRVRATGLTVTHG